MSEINFVNRLGDALDAAIADAPPVRRRRSRRRLGVYLAAGAMVVGGAAATAAGVFNETSRATISIACYDDLTLAGGTYIFAGDRSPVDACADALERPAAQLTACTQGDVVAVVPAHDCTAAGLAPLATDYEPARRRVAALQDAVVRLERETDCLPPAELARRVQALLDRLGWTGWRTVVREESGPCGRVSGPVGDGHRDLSGALNADRHLVTVYTSLPLSVMDALYGVHGVVGPLMDASGDRCYTQDELIALATERLRPVVVRIERTTAERLPEGVGIDGRRGIRYNAGCAVISDVVTGASNDSVILQLAQR